MNCFLLRTISALLVSSLLLAGISVSPAFAQDAAPELSDTEKRELGGLIEAGKAAYDRGQFDKSLQYFKDAYEIVPHPDIVFRIGLCYERLGEDKAALIHYRRFLKEVPDAPERGRIEKTIELIESRLMKRASKIRITSSPDGAAVHLNHEENPCAGYTPTELPVEPGNYKIIVKKDGYETVVEQIDVPVGQTLQLRYQLRSDGAASPNTQVTATTTEEDQKPSIVLPLTFALLGTGAMVAGLVLLSNAADKQQQYDDASAQATTQNSLSREDFDREFGHLEEDAKTNMIFGWSAFGVSLVAFGISYALWPDKFVQVQTSARRSTSWPSVWVGFDRVGASWSRSF